MARLSMNEVTTYRWSFEEDIANYTAAGIPAIGVWRRKLADYGEKAGIQRLAESGLAVSNLLWTGGFTGNDGRNYAESLADAAEAIRLAHAMRAECLVVYSGGRGGHTQNHARRLFVSALKELLPLASEFDVTLAVEPMHEACAGEWTFLTSAQEAIKLLDAVGSSRLQVVFDTYHLGHDKQVFDDIQQLAGRIAVVHLGDSRGLPTRDQNRVGLGQGTLPLREIVAALHDSGFDGYYDIELIGEEICTEIESSGCYRRLLESSKHAFEELASVAH